MQLAARREELRSHGLTFASGGPPPKVAGPILVVPYHDDEERRLRQRLEDQLGWRLTADEVTEVRALRRQGKGEEEVLRTLVD
jgi:hypothetical protein